jgi:hypothetical protein
VSKITKRQLLKLYGICVITILLFPPFHSVGFHGASQNRGYSFILIPPADQYAVVDIAMLFTQLFFLTVIALVVWIHNGYELKH